MKKRLPKSTKKYIRREKSRIRREVLNLKEQVKKIQELYNKFTKKKVVETPSPQTERGEGKKSQGRALTELDRTEKRRKNKLAEKPVF